ncbi:histidine triad nucleotide-binding protein [Helicobacter sp. 12S02634-8]|uniref:histidine triad nucleotide-binding protein n=1 Tax=Helicobacter sp. 12S02634-8 TaxID=1476199 RepID=UPI000BA65C75|nr:histidine triad nucleotide-binding protein [Helicobacter sp. 12S02634-8]PAF47356.1 histidine triad nucleotide-binding protein [Helicobacter sp. 12S02634-8]
MNIFEKIVAGELPCKKVLENSKFLAFHDIAPKAPIHVLAIPKQCIKDFNAVTPDLMAEMSDFILEVVEELGIKDSGYRLITNIGKDGGQEVPHLHFHILGGAPLHWPYLA